MYIQNTISLQECVRYNFFVSCKSLNEYILVKCKFGVTLLCHKVNMYTCIYI